MSEFNKTQKILFEQLQRHATHYIESEERGIVVDDLDVDSFIEECSKLVQANDVDTGEKQCNLPVVTPRYFYVVESNSEDGLDQISIGLESLERAKKFKDTECHKKTYPNSFIVCTFNEG